MSGLKMKSLQLTSEFQEQFTKTGKKNQVSLDMVFDKQPSDFSTAFRNPYSTWKM